MRPATLMHSDESEQTPQIEANANNIEKDAIDCGITAMGCCNTPGCQKLGTTNTFLGFLILTGIIQGAIETYFRISAKQAALEHNYDPQIVDWLLASSGIAQGIIAIFIAYWGNRFHRTGWLGGILMLQATVCLTVIVPTIVNNNDEMMTIQQTLPSVMCVERITGAFTIEKSYSMTTLSLLFGVQVAIAFGHVAFYCLGLSYIDDNVREHESPGLLGAALAAKYWGPQLGSAVSLGVGAVSLGWWLGFTILAPFLFVAGFAIALFPKNLLSTVVRNAANNIIEVARSNSQSSLDPNKFLADVGFFQSMWRLITNKILIINAVAAMFVQTGLVNFMRHEQDYMQSRFYLPTSEADGLNNEWTSQLVTHLLFPPLVALAILVAGLIIAKANPNPRKLAAWNVITGTLVVCLFVGYIFIDCDNAPIAGAYRGKLTKPFCAHDCLCDENVPFSPICPQNGLQTYYSPCFAGCSTEIILNDLRVFSNCSCGVDTEMKLTNALATEGACGYGNCQKYWILFQVLIIIAGALLGSGIVGNIVLSIRSVLAQDKALALSIELWLIGLFVYIPGKIAYRAIYSTTCQYWSNDGSCHLHESPLFGNIMNIVTASLVALGVFFDIIVFFLVKDLPLYGDDPEDVYRPIPLQPISTTNRYGDLQDDFELNTRQMVNEDDSLLNNNNNNTVINQQQEMTAGSLIHSIQNTQEDYQRSTSPLSAGSAPPAFRSKHATEVDSDVGSVLSDGTLRSELMRNDNQITSMYDNGFDQQLQQKRLTDEINDYNDNRKKNNMSPETDF